MPTVIELTDRVLKVPHEELKGLHPLHYSGDKKLQVEGAQMLLKQLVEYAAYRGLENITYEDLYSLLIKVEQNCYAPRQDPTSRDLVDFTRSKLNGTEYFNLHDNDLQRTASKTHQFIAQVVRWEIESHTITKPEGLDHIKTYIDLVGPENIDIITLNHDTLVEKLLDDSEHKNAWTDGFDDHETGKREEFNEETKRSRRVDTQLSYLDPKSFQDPSRCRIIKPHGSCNWFQVEWQGRHQLMIARDGFQEGLQNAQGEIISESPIESGILTGSFTKEASYLFWDTGYMFRSAYRILHEYDRVICSGYGWKDFGINKMFVEWAQKTNNKKLLVLAKKEGHETAYSSVERLSYQFTAKDMFNVRLMHPHWLSETEPKQALKLLGISY